MPVMPFLGDHKPVKPILGTFFRISTGDVKNILAGGGFLYRMITALCEIACYSMTLTNPNSLGPALVQISFGLCMHMYSHKMQHANLVVTA